MNKEAIATKPTPAETYDWFLQALVNMANRSSLEVEVTLQRSGFLISGLLVNGQAYVEGLAKDFSIAPSNGPEVYEQVRNRFSKFGENLDLEEGDETLLPQYIHLKNARFFNVSGTSISEDRAVWWRGRISEVCGFMLGGLTNEES